MVSVVAFHLINKWFFSGSAEIISWLSEEQLFIPPHLLPHLLLNLCFHGNPARPSPQFVPTKDFTDISSCVTRSHSLISRVNINLTYSLPARSIRPCCALKHTHHMMLYKLWKSMKKTCVVLSLSHHLRALLCPRCFQEGHDHPVTTQIFTYVCNLLLGVTRIILIWLSSSFTCIPSGPYFPGLPGSPSLPVSPCDNKHISSYCRIPKG